MEFDHFESLYPAKSRQREISELISLITEGNSVQLLGLPGTGRSNILRFLTYSTTIRKSHVKDEKAHFVLIDFSEVKRRSLFDVTKYIYLCLTDSLLERRLTEEYEKVHSLFKEALSLKDELVLFQSLKQALDYLATEKMMSVIFLADRFDEYIPDVTSEFFTNLRSLRDRVKYQFSIVFALTRPLEEVLEEELLADFYEFVGGHYVYVSLLDEASLSFRLSYLEKITGKKLTKEIKEELITLTGGHGRLMRICVEAVLATTEITDLEQFLLSQKTVKNALSKIWKSLTPSEQQVLHGNSNDLEMTEIYLEEVGLMKEGKNDLPLLNIFIQKQSSEHTQKIEIMLNPNTQEIKKGEIVLSDSLTGAEYKLLSFLILNSQRVIDRDEIISTVWDTNKSYMGVTDQALDQLIFRLRKKIEDNPNTPTHLQTVKGRGFRFTV